jgi:type I restriction enzyme S subunit
MTWKTKTLAKLCKMYQPKTLSKKQLKSEGKYYVYGANGIIGKYDNFNHKDSELLVTCRGATCGSINISKPFSWINGNAMVIQPNEDEILKKYLEYFFYGVIDFRKVITGSAQPQITRESLNPILIDYPSVLEQQRIIDKIDAVFIEIDKFEQALDKKKQNLIEFERQIIDKTFKKIKTEKNNYTLAHLIELGWIESHLDGNHGSDYPKKNEFIENGIPYISANCISENRVIMEKSKFLSKERVGKFRKGIAKNGDVLFAHNASVGPVAILETQEEKIIIGTSLTYYRCAKKRIFNKYLLAYMRSNQFVNQYLDVMRQATRNQVPITKQREFIFLIPSFETQIEVAEKINTLSLSNKTLLSKIQKLKEQLKYLKSSILFKELKSNIAA